MSGDVQAAEHHSTPRCCVWSSGPSSGVLCTNFVAYSLGLRRHIRVDASVTRDVDIQLGVSFFWAYVVSRQFGLTGIDDRRTTTVVHVGVRKHWIGRLSSESSREFLSSGVHQNAEMRREVCDVHYTSSPMPTGDKRGIVVLSSLNLIRVIKHNTGMPIVND